MTERKWTSGPWLVTATPDLSLFVCEYGSHNVIATIGTVNRNDAHLIAAAPELYEALESAGRKLLAYVGVCRGDKELTESIIPMIHAALEKARGET